MWGSALWHGVGVGSGFVLDIVMSSFLHHHFPPLPNTMLHKALAPCQHGAEPVSLPGEHITQNTSTTENAGLLPESY